jgi:hypothetical protein|tara:strand:+ start:106 stop:1128 length:1023 start_codon:yes stop_codon:yes gene_type:complete
MNNKQQLGQFFTTNYTYILQNFNIPNNVESIVEPFAGNGDLLNFIDKDKYDISCFDIDPKQSYITQRDTLMDPPDITNKFVITNPPYLARNKSEDKTVFNHYKTNDLYKCFIKILTDSECVGGILIVPLNFFCSVRKQDIELRTNFMKKFNIDFINIFEEKVFDDTSYTVCSFQFSTGPRGIPCPVIIYPSKKEIEVEFNAENNYTVGGEIYKLSQTEQYTITRATADNKDPGTLTNILLKCIDDGTHNKIGCKIDKQYIDTTPNLSARSYATLVIYPSITNTQQEDLCEKFNKYLNDMRDKYYSLFLTNFRESTATMARKRISFGLAFKIINHLLRSHS